VQRYVPLIVRIFQEKPLFIVPRGQPIETAEPIDFPTRDGLTLKGSYLKTSAPRRGVIVFGLEFGSNRWSCQAYCEHLLAAGFDVFAYEPRNQGDSDRQEGYEPLQWVTEYEAIDAQAALSYLKARPDADPRGVGFFGISKGAGAMVVAAANDSFVRCFVTDGMFATFGTLIPYMRQWFKIYNRYFPIQLIPDWYVDYIGRIGLRRIERQRGCLFPSLEAAVSRLAPRPLLLIHGEGDTYIKADMARALFGCAGEPKEFWLVPGAKHNQALHVAGDEYRDRVLRFFEQHLTTGGEAAPPASEQPPRLARINQPA
jgi:dipeptidyl aminopeptidase/acylaminoacyl peptidase